MSVARAQEEVSSAEFTDWMALEQVEPWGDRRADVRSAIVAMTVGNMLRGSEARMFTVADFLPRFGPRPRLSDAELAEKIIAAVTAASEV